MCLLYPEIRFRLNTKKRTQFMSIKLCIFDFDGTLADTFPVLLSSLDALAKQHRFRQLPKELRAGLHKMSAMKVLRELDIPMWKAPGVLTDVRKIMQDRINEIRLFPGIFCVLETLRLRKIGLAVVTSNSFENVRTILGDSLVTQLIAVECGSSLFGKAQRLRRVIKKSRVHRDSVLYIGDEIRDAEAADRVGVQFGAVSWGYTELVALMRTEPATFFRTPGDLLDLV
jgi:phosphoglycolate phosphatase